MARRFWAACLVMNGLLWAQNPPDTKKKPPPTQQEDDPPEEDVSSRPREYPFNPLQAKKSITAGNYYFKKGNFAAARDRYEDATKYDPGSSEGYLKLGEALERMNKKAQARAAYEKYIELAQDPKVTDSLKKRIEKWPTK